MTDIDIVERLREIARNYADGVAGMTPQDHPAWKAADEIERLRAALHAIADRERPSTARSMARRALEPKP